MRCKFQLFDLIIDKIKEPISYYIDLLDNRVVFHVEAILDKEPIPEEEIYNSEENVYLLEEVIVKKESIIGLYYTYKKIESKSTGEIDLFVVGLNSGSSENNIEVSFNNKKAADKFYKQASNYIFNENKPVHGSESE